MLVVGEVTQMGSVSAIWIALGGNVVFLGVVAFLGRSVIGQWLNKDLERFKGDLRNSANAELEQLRSSLEIAANEHSILLTRLQDRRAEVIDQLYGRLATAIADSKLFIAFQSSESPESDPKHVKVYERASESLNTFRDYFDQKRVWVPEECCSKIELLQDAIVQAFNDYVFAIHRSNARSGKKAIAKAWDDIRQDLVPPARAALEGEMRALLEPPRRLSVRATMSPGAATVAASSPPKTL
jgi:hypothetical protein